jgi:hypothetical protein
MSFRQEKHRRIEMIAAEYQQLADDIREFLQSGKLTPEQFGEMAQMYSHLEGEPIERLSKYEQTGAWHKILAVSR